MYKIIYNENSRLPLKDKIYIGKDKKHKDEI